MSADSTPGLDPVEEFPPLRPRASLRTWYRAWREVVRNPHKTIPEPHLPAEGEPIPAALELRCPECGAALAGVCEWTCPKCGEHFSPRRAYTLRMLKDPEYFLRYRFSPQDMRVMILTVLMLVTGLIVAVAAGAKHTITLSMRSSVSAQTTLGLRTLAYVSGLVLPCLVLMKYTRDIAWFRVAFYFSIIWFLTAGFVLAMRLR